MSIDPTPTSDHLDRNSKEAVRAGTRTRFNLWVLVFGLALVLAGLFAIVGLNAGGSAGDDVGQTQRDAAAFSTEIEPAKGDSPVAGESVNPENAAPTQPAPAAP